MWNNCVSVVIILFNSLKNITGSALSKSVDDGELIIRLEDNQRDVAETEKWVDKTSWNLGKENVKGSESGMEQPYVHKNRGWVLD